MARLGRSYPTRPLTRPLRIVNVSGATTQPAIARIANIVTKTQPAIARIATNLTKTQSATARIANNFTKTQPAVARVTVNITSTQTATARIQRNLTRTQPSIARIAGNFTKTQSATARIGQTGTKTQSAIARIANSPTKTQSSVARIQRVITKTQGAVARVATNLTKTQSAIANITTGGSSTWAFVQQAMNEGTSPVTATFGSTPGTGNLLIAVVKRNTQGGTAVSVSGGGSAWTQASASPLNYNGTSSQLCLFYKLADSGQATAIATAGSGTHFLSVYEFSGAPSTLTGIVDVSNTTTGAAATTTSGSQPSITTTNAGDLVFSTVGMASTVTSPSWTGASIGESNFTALIQLIDGYQIETVTGTYTPSLAWTTSRAWGQLTLAFVPGSGGTAPGTPTGLTVSADNEYRARISWTAADALQTNFILQRSTDHVTWSTVASPTNAYYMDTGLSAGTTYYYQVAATNSFGTSSYAAYQSCTTKAANSPWTSKIEGWMYPTDVYSPVTDYTDGRGPYAIKPEYFTVASGGVITQLNAPADGTYAWSTANGNSVRAYSHDQFITVSANYTNFHSLMGSSTNQSAGITALVNFCTNNSFTGVELDWEGYSSWTSTDYTSYKSFLTSLASSLHSNGLKLMVDGPPIGDPTTYTDLAQSFYKFKYEEVAPLVDYVCVLAYDYEFDYGAGQPVQPTAWLQTIADWVIAKVGWANLGQIVIGMPSYGYHGTTGGFGITIDAYNDSTGFTGFGGATRDGSSGEMMFTNAGTSYVFSDSTTLDGKRKTIEDKGILNTSVWYLGGNQWFTGTRLEPTRFKPQTATARISNSFTKTQTATAHIKCTVTKTQPAIARVAVNITKTQSATARIQRLLTKTQSATANIQPTAAGTKTQPALARIANTLNKTQASTARVAVNFTKTQGAVARVANNRTKTQPAIARVASVVTKTQPALARIQRVVAKTQTAVARIAQPGAKTQGATARIANSFTRTQPATARVAIKRSLTQPAIGRIAVKFTKTQSATALIGTIASIRTLTQTATARIVTGALSGKSIAAGFSAPTIHADFSNPLVAEFMSSPRVAASFSHPRLTASFSVPTIQAIFSNPSIQAKVL